MCRIREAQPEDAFAISRVLLEARETGYRGVLPDQVVDWMRTQMDPAKWGEILRAQRSGIYGIAVAEVEGQVVAHADWGRDRDGDRIEEVGELLSLFVLPSSSGSQRRGYEISGSGAQFCGCYRTISEHDAFMNALVGSLTRHRATWNWVAAGSVNCATARFSERRRCLRSANEVSVWPGMHSQRSREKTHEARIPTGTVPGETTGQAAFWERHNSKTVFVCGRPAPDFAEHALELLTTAPPSPFFEMLLRHERGELLRDRRAHQLIDGDSLAASQLLDLVVERVRKPEAERAHLRTPMV